MQACPFVGAGLTSSVCFDSTSPTFTLCFEPISMNALQWPHQCQLLVMFTTTVGHSIRHWAAAGEGVPYDVCLFSMEATHWQALQDIDHQQGRSQTKSPSGCRKKGRRHLPKVCLLAYAVM